MNENAKTHWTIENMNEAKRSECLNRTEGSPKGYYIKVLGVDAFRGNTRSHPEHDG